MTAYRFVTLTCDPCGEIWDEASTTSTREARRIARSMGWRYVDGRDECLLHHGFKRDPMGFGYERIEGPE